MHPMSGKHYLREWRRKRDLTQEQVVNRLVAMDDPHLPATAASLSRLENGKQPYSERVLEALADIYDTEPEHLIGRNPFKEGDVIDFVARLNERQRQQVMAFMAAITIEA